MLYLWEKLNVSISELLIVTRCEENCNKKYPDVTDVWHNWEE